MILRSLFGPQKVVSSLQAALVRQLLFSRHVVDLRTRPVFEATARQPSFVPDMIVQLSPTGDEDPYFLILDVAEDISPERRGQGNAACWDEKVVYRRVGAREILTPYLRNVGRLRRACAEDRVSSIDVRVLIHLAVQQGPTTIKEVAEKLQNAGLTERRARTEIYRVIVNRTVVCDLSIDLTDAALVSANRPERQDRLRSTPVFAAILDAI